MIIEFDMTNLGSLSFFHGLEYAATMKVLVVH